MEDETEFLTRRLRVRECKCLERAEFIGRESDCRSRCCFVWLREQRAAFSELPLLAGCCQRTRSGPAALGSRGSTAAAAQPQRSLRTERSAAKRVTQIRLLLHKGQRINRINRYKHAGHPPRTKTPALLL